MYVCVVVWCPLVPFHLLSLPMKSLSIVESARETPRTQSSLSFSDPPFVTHLLMIAHNDYNRFADGHVFGAEHSSLEVIAALRLDKVDWYFSLQRRLAKFVAAWSVDGGGWELDIMVHVLMGALGVVIEY